MIRTPQQRRGRGRAAGSASVPAATGGWDALSPLAGMARDRAVVLDNWFPEPGFLRIRRGYQPHSEVGPGHVESLLVYNGLTASKMFAAAGTVIYDVTNPWDAIAVPTPFNSARWQGVNFTTSGGKFLFIVNGADIPHHFNGTAWAQASITGTSASNAVHVEAHKRRLWLTLANATKAAYLPLDSIGGAASEFDFGAVFTLGGVLQCIGTWTRDGGAGPDDYLVALSSKGQAAVYAGTDPASASTWSLVGVYNLGAPIGRRCMLKLGTDLAIITLDGVISLEAALQKDRAAKADYALTTKIQNAMNVAAKAYKDNLGWQLVSYPQGTAALLNVPLAANGAAHQYVMNTLTGAWTRFTGMDAQCWVVFEEDLYFGSSIVKGEDTYGRIFKADYGAQDHDKAITVDSQGAFWDFGAPGELKQIKLIQPLLVTGGEITPALAVNVDFETGAATNPVASTTIGGAVWDGFNWDEGIWGAETQSTSDWAAVNALGQWASIRISASVRASPGAACHFDQSHFDEAVFDNVAAQPITLQLNGFNVVYQRGQGL